MMIIHMFYNERQEKTSRIFVREVLNITLTLSIIFLFLPKYVYFASLHINITQVNTSRYSSSWLKKWHKRFKHEDNKCMIVAMYGLSTPFEPFFKNFCKNE